MNNSILAKINELHYLLKSKVLREQNTEYVHFDKRELGENLKISRSSRHYPGR